MTNRILDLSPYKYRDLERQKVLDNNNQPIVKKVKNPETGEETDQYMYDMIESEITCPTEDIKKIYAGILGNSGNSPDPAFRVTGRDKYRRNKLGDRIEECKDDTLELTGNDYKMIDAAVDELGGHFPKKHSILLERVFDAPEVEKKQS